MKIKQGKDTPLNANSGTLPNVYSAMLDWFQPMSFGVVSKTTQSFQASEVMTVTNFMGVWQPLNGKQLVMKPEGQRQWEWFQVHADPSLNLNVDDVITYLGVQYRVMLKKNFSQYGYNEYHLVDDYTGSGPAVAP